MSVAPIVSPEFCTGRELWLSGMPSTLSPADPAWEPGQVGAITHTGLGAGVLSIFKGGPTDTFSIRVEILSTGILGAATMRWRLQDGKMLLQGADPDGDVVMQSLQQGVALIVQSGASAGYAVAPGAVQGQQDVTLTVTPATTGAQLAALARGGAAGLLATPVALGAGTSVCGQALPRTPLPIDPWSLTTTIPPDADGLGYSVFDLAESGLVVQFTAGTFTRGDAYAFFTRESPQQARLRRQVSDEIARKLRVRGQLPLPQVGEDLKLIAARMVAYEMLALRGYDPQNAHDKLVLGRADWARTKLVDIAEELEQGDQDGQGVVAGIAARSQPPQGVGPW